jgi:hypothetical protein
MSKVRFTLNILAIAVFTLTVASMAQAQASRTWVSGVGDDANPCSRTAPCKTFAGAISKTAMNGEIDALDPAGFGTINITKSITIDGSPTGVAGILNAGTTGVIVNITNAADARKSVTIRGLSIQGASTGTIGVRVIAGNRVYVENCFISGQNFSATSDGIKDERTAANSLLEVDNTTITNNSGNGINITPTAGSSGVHVHVSNSRLQGNSNTGMVLATGAKGTIYNSVITGHSGTGGGFFLSGTSELSVDHCVVSNNNVGFIASAAGSVIRVSNTTAINNTTLANAAGGGVVTSYGNNQTGGVGSPFPSSATTQQ